jgi:hypothetical protein
MNFRLGTQKIAAILKIRNCMELLRELVLKTIPIGFLVTHKIRTPRGKRATPERLSSLTQCFSG